MPVIFGGYVYHGNLGRWLRSIVGGKESDRKVNDGPACLRPAPRDDVSKPALPRIARVPVTDETRYKGRRANDRAVWNTSQFQNADDIHDAVDQFIAGCIAAFAKKRKQEAFEDQVFDYVSFAAKHGFSVPPPGGHV